MGSCGGRCLAAELDATRIAGQLEAELEEEEEEEVKNCLLLLLLVVVVALVVAPVVEQVERMESSTLLVDLLVMQSILVGKCM